MRLESKKLLWDAQRAAELICRFVDGKDFDAYRSDVLLRSAVERQFEIIGEAHGKIARIAPETAANIGDLGRIIAFRNILVHGYAAVDDRLVWGVVEAKLPALLSDIRRLLGQDAG